MAELIFAKDGGNYSAAIKLEQDKDINKISQFLPANIRRILDNLSPAQVNQIEEIRLRKNRPLFLRLFENEIMLNNSGQTVQNSLLAYHVTTDDISRTLHLISQSSLYALEEEMRNGYLTLPGGHRIGFVGQTVLEGGRVKTIKHISSLNLRIAKQVLGCAKNIMELLYNHSTLKPYHTLIISPPRCGKTTLLRDIIREFSSGFYSKVLGKILHFNVGVVDERSEIAGCYLGVPQNNVGPKTDVLDACPKAEGMIMLVRSMSPHIIATDEIGREEDVKAIEEILNCGISVLTTAHGDSVTELANRPILKQLIQKNVFERYVLLSRTFGPGTIESVLDAKTKHNLLSKPIYGPRKEMLGC